MRRRGAGIGAIQKDKLAAAKYKEKGNEIQEANVQEMSKQMEKFRANLEEFARNHKQDIKKDPAFRKHFQDMCASIGVDPLASSKGFWSEMLGFGDFYYELGVQIIEVCMATSHKTGGLMELEELRRRLIKSRMGSRQRRRLQASSDNNDHSQTEISQDDVLRSIKKLKVLGNGFSVIPLGSGSGGRLLVQSVPGELSMDQTAILQQAESNGGWVTARGLCQDLGWEPQRSSRTLDKMLADEIAWLDTQATEDGATGQDMYWIPSLFAASSVASVG